MDTSQAKTDDSQNASGEKGRYVTLITVSANKHELSSSCCPRSLIVGASSSSSHCSPRSATASCSSNRWDLSPACDDGFIPIACDGYDPGTSSDIIQLRSDSFYLRKRKGRGGRNRARKGGSGKNTVVKVDSTETRKNKMMKGVLNNNNNRSKEMGEVPFSALQQPKMFYSKAMVMNPWSQLKPVVGCVLVPLTLGQEFSRSWLPDSVAVKEHSVTCMSDERTMATLRSRRLEQDRSLADCLAMSFEEAANE